MADSPRPELTDGVVVVRRYRTGDVVDVFEAVAESVEAIYPWMEWAHPGYAIDDTRAWVSAQPDMWRSGTAYSLLIADAATGTVLGSTGINRIDTLHRNANLGYWVRTSWAGQGVATRAARLAARFGLGDLGLIRVEIKAAVGNVPSHRVAEKAGAHYEGIQRAALFLHGRAHDAKLWSLTREDLSALPVG